MSRKILTFLLGFSILIFVVPTVKATSIETCVERGEDTSLITSCGYNFEDKIFPCLKDSPADYDIWGLKPTETDFGPMTETPNEASQRFANTVCNQIKKVQFFGADACSDWCAKSYITKDSEFQLPALFKDKYGEKNCPIFFNTEKQSVIAGKWDSLMTATCNNRDQKGCITSMTAAIANDINKKHDNVCQGIVLEDSSIITSLKTALELRYDLEEVVAKQTAEQDTARTKMREIINLVKEQPDRPWPNRYNCSQYRKDVSANLEKVDASDLIWSCKKGIAECQDDFTNYLINDYKVWIRDLDPIYKTNPVGTQEALNCIDEFDTNSMTNYIKGDIERTKIYFTKQEERKILIQDGKDVVDGSSDLFGASISQEGLSQAYEIVTCGFASSPQNQCCTNTAQDFKQPTSNLTKKCFIPNPFNKDACFFDTATVTDALMGLVSSGLESETGDITKFINEYGGVPACFVGRQKGVVGEASCTCEPSDGAEICRRYIANNTDANTDQWNEYKPFSDCTTCMESNDRLAPGEGLKIYTGLGCVDTSIAGITEFVFSIVLGIAGTASLFCIIISAFQMQISRGNPEQLQKAQGLVTSCITGLIVVIFSVIILQIIGVDILRLPGWG